MKQKISIIILLINFLSVISITAQKRTEDFQINIPEERNIKSAFKTITLIDARPDTTNVGIVQKGAFNAKAKVVPVTPLRNQFQNLLTSITNKDSEDGELVLYLKQFYFAEVTGAISEKGYCYFQAYLFSKNKEEKFQLVDAMDSVIVHSSMDVTKATMKKGSALVSNFILKNLYNKDNSNAAYTYEEVKNYDNIAKQKLALYNSSTLPDGLYTNFQNFRELIVSNVPVVNIKSTPNGDKAYKVYTSKNDKEKEVDKSDYYAMVYKGIPYVYSDTDHAFLKMTKKNADGDYYFTAKAKATAKTGNVIAASAFFGIIGGLIAADAKSEFEMKLDYLNGGFMPIKEIDQK